TESYKPQRRDNIMTHRVNLSRQTCRNPSANAGTHTPRPSQRARGECWQTILAGGYGPLLSQGDGERGLRLHAALIFAMKRSSSSRSRVLSVDSVRAEFNTSSEAEPVSVAPRLTCMTLAAASCVPCATFWTLRAISCVAELCCSTALAMVEAMSEIFPMVPPISLMAATDSCVAPCMPEM